jgi:hypothetical protein
MATPTIKDDVYERTVYAKTTYANGKTVIKETLTPLVKAVSCPWISNGKLQVTVNTTTLVVDYGTPNNGGCDNKATLTWPGGQKIITLSL